jgi:hypothetical protein
MHKCIFEKIQISMSLVILPPVTALADYRNLRARESRLEGLGNHSRSKIAD